MCGLRYYVAVRGIPAVDGTCTRMEDFLRRGGGRAGEVAVRIEEGSEGVEGPQDCACLVVRNGEYVRIRTGEYGAPMVFGQVNTSYRAQKLVLKHGPMTLGAGGRTEIQKTRGQIAAIKPAFDANEQ